MCAKSLQLCPDLRPFGASVHEILQTTQWSGLSFPSLGDLPDPGMEPMSFTSPSSAGRFFTTSTTYDT